MKLIYATSDFEFKPGDFVAVVKRDRSYIAYPSDAFIEASPGFYNGRVVSLEGVKGDILLIELIKKNLDIQTTVISNDAMGTAIKVPTPKISTSLVVVRKDPNVD